MKTFNQLFSDEMILESVVFIKFVMIIVGSVFAGYTVSDLKPEFLNEFNKPWVQFIIYLILSASLFDFNIRQKKFNLVGIILSSLVVTLLMQFIKKQVNKKQE